MASRGRRPNSGGGGSPNVRISWKGRRRKQGSHPKPSLSLLLTSSGGGGKVGGGTEVPFGEKKKGFDKESQVLASALLGEKKGRNLRKGEETNGDLGGGGGVLSGNVKKSRGLFVGESPFPTNSKKKEEGRSPIRTWEDKPWTTTR